MKPPTPVRKLIKTNQRTLYQFTKGYPDKNLKKYSKLTALFAKQKMCRKTYIFIKYSLQKDLSRKSLAMLESNTIGRYYIKDFSHLVRSPEVFDFFCLEIFFTI